MKLEVQISFQDFHTLKIIKVSQSYKMNEAVNKDDNPPKIHINRTCLLHINIHSSRRLVCF